MKAKFSFIVLTVTSLLMLASCATSTKLASFGKMYEEDPLVFIIMPPINNSTNVDAKDYFYTTMNVPVAEAGYYVLPPYLALETLQKESAYDSENFLEADLSKFNKLFGADVAVFTVIKKWEKSMIGSSVTVEIEYIFRSTKTNETVYHRDATIVVDTRSQTKVGGFGLLGAIANLATDVISTAATDYVSVARRCNSSALSDMPAGKYSEKHTLDKAEGAMGEVIRISATK